MIAQALVAAAVLAALSYAGYRLYRLTDDALERLMIACAATAGIAGGLCLVVLMGMLSWRAAGWLLGHP